MEAADVDFGQLSEEINLDNILMEGDVDENGKLGDALMLEEPINDKKLYDISKSPESNFMETNEMETEQFTENATDDLTESKQLNEQSTAFEHSDELGQNGFNDPTGETEVVSEDELPAVEKPRVQDAENVSDDELPGPKAAELPEDTEVVSEDELPSSKKDEKEQMTDANRKRKQDDSSDGEKDKDASAEKKQAVASSDESKPVPSEKRPSIDENEKKKLPDLEKYWKTVNDDPTDFTGWTYLLQYVDQENDVEAAREAYDAFLSHYPYCYGYWRKFADYEKKKGSKKKCMEVLEKGLKAIPLSVDLWIHFLNHIKTVRSEDHIYIRSQFERAIEACGLEFRSDRLWELYLKWETENGSPLHVTNIYDRLLATPTLGYTTHFDNFQEHIMSSPVTAAITRKELVSIKGEVRANTNIVPTDLPPGEDEPEDHIASDEEAQSIKERIIATRRKVHKATGEQVTLRWSYEEGIKRPYFHVKPLERCQLKNWKAYLDWEKQNGSFERALVLHERCLIACALYEEFWLRLVKFLEEKMEEKPELVEKCRGVLERACTVHHTASPALHLRWASFEEERGGVSKAADILERLETSRPGLLQTAYRRANLERRRGDNEKAVSILKGAIAAAKPLAAASALAVKLARLQHRFDPEAAEKTLDEAIQKDPLCARLYLQKLQLALHTEPVDYKNLDDILESYCKQEGADSDMVASFARRALELAEEMAPDARSVRIAADKHKIRARAARHQRHTEMTKRKESNNTGNNTSNTNIINSYDNSQQQMSSSNQTQGGQNMQYNSGPHGPQSGYGPGPAWPQYSQPQPYNNPWHQYPNYY